MTINKTKGIAGSRKGLPSLRRCVGCRGMINVTELIRVVKSPDGVFAPDAQKTPGRGAYICKNADCLAKAIKTKGLDRSFKKKVPQEIYIGLGEMMK